jgi:NADPH-dependent glutamate synthase beta subunit-like oxidoreductase
MPDRSQHVVLIVGGAVAGSEVACQLAQHDVRCIVLEKSDRPYGKIEDGLPRWHTNLRRQEERKIDDKLARPNIHFVPRTSLGRDLTLPTVLGWGVSAVVLAVGAWRDRPLPLPGIDAYLGRGFYYQNPFVYWFNHYPEPDYDGPKVSVEDGAIVVGGGLASLDVVKIIMLETVNRALEARGHKVELYEMERRGIAPTLQEVGLTMGDLGLHGCTLVCRRPVEDLPLAEMPAGASPQQAAKTRATRRKLLQNFTDKYLFQVMDRTVAAGYLTERDRLAGLRLAAVEIKDEGPVPVPESHEDYPAPLVVSSIGSIPEPIPGVQMNGSLYRIRDQRTGELEGLDGVFAVGNAVTGRGNILVSQKHGRLVSQQMLEHYLLGTASGYEDILSGAAEAARAKVEAVADRLAGRSPLPAEAVREILAQVAAFQRRVEYPGDYREWIAQVRPATI